MTPQGWHRDSTIVDRMGTYGAGTPYRKACAANPSPLYGCAHNPSSLYSLPLPPPDRKTCAINPSMCRPPPACGVAVAASNPPLSLSPPPIRPHHGRCRRGPAGADLDALLQAARRSQSPLLCARRRPLPCAPLPVASASALWPLPCAPVLLCPMPAASGAWRELTEVSGGSLCPRPAGHGPPKRWCNPA